ncbi:DUF6115 domain-containing protein [Salipaludibacillus sp. CF4.18]|uniref:DUF6115 domain-containing protein n=1 Tax=Salipaludibacillus sp. CF4.18 TaxID=3373081 RepID=UPI003EE7054D
MVYLVIISLALHFVSFYIMILLYQRMERTKPLDKEKTMKELEDLLLSYTTEMKDNNERLARRVSKLSANSSPKVNEHRKIENIPEPITDPDQSLVNTFPDSADHEEDYKEYEPPLPDETSEEIALDSSTTSRVLSLYKRGNSITDIAKELRIGAGEVELLLKFYK